jgi:hypothetical protein
MNANTSSECTPYWDEADWLMPWYILERWCQRDEACMQAKLQAMLSACERGDVNYRRSDGKTFDDPIHELFKRGKLLIERNSFNQWCIKLEGKSPLTGRASSPTISAPPMPSWAHDWARAAPRSGSVNKFPQSPGSGLGEPVSNSNARVASPQSDIAVDGLSDMQLRKLGVPSDEIVDAFKVTLNSRENSDWWRQRMSNAKRNKKLLQARVRAGKSSEGDQRIQSWWDPMLIASFLIQGGHMHPSKAVRILDESFADFASDSHLLLP